METMFIVYCLLFIYMFITVFQHQLVAQLEDDDLFSFQWPEGVPRTVGNPKISEELGRLVPMYPLVI